MIEIKIRKIPNWKRKKLREEIREEKQILREVEHEGEKKYPNDLNKRSNYITKEYRKRVYKNG